MNILKTLIKKRIRQEGISASVAVLLVLVSAVTGLAAGSDSTLNPLLFQSPGDTPTPTATSDTSPINTPTNTPLPPSPTHTHTPVPTATSTGTPTPTPTATSDTSPIGPPTSTPTSTPTAPARPTLTPIPTPTRTPTPKPLPSTGFYYRVRPGDNLFRLALRFGTTIQAIVRANGIVNPRLIFVGQVLWIPSSAGGPGPINPTIYVVQRGDTLYSIARRFGTTYQVLAAVNHLRNPRLIYVGQRLIIPGSGVPGPPPPSHRVHVVRRGETLWSIALRYGTTPWAIAVANGLRNPSLIYPGQRLIIP